jgi:hypothetical protein
VSKPSDDPGKGGSGAASKGTSNHGSPPSDGAPKSDSGG